VGADLEGAAEVAVAAGTAVVTRPRTSVCTPEDLAGAGSGGLISTQELLRRCAEHRRAGRTIAFTCGCFDVLHAGHVACLAAAAREADVVVVGLNDDAGVRAIKGVGRPVNGLADRAAVVAALGMVDLLVTFHEDAPLQLLAALAPDVIIKGADHDVAALPEARLVRDLGGRVVTVPLLSDRSTTGLIAACAALAVA
jgi:D-beta-D-heptose 7-phosphate kinase / D-beta-D-heptose 1-phosphate adenosyltransferase